MSLRVGVIGCGAMGTDHIRTLATSVAEARVSEVYDADPERARAAASEVGARTATSADALIVSHDVDAVIICSPDSTHADLTRCCISVGKQVLCEKPLAVTVEDSLKIVEAEVEGGRRLVQVGFMRRYDRGYNALRDAVRAGELGVPRIVHCLHRNAAAHPSVTSEGIVTNSMIHELDLVRWLLDDEVASIEVRSPVREGLLDPQLASIEMLAGTLVSVEVFVNARYGYDVRCEVVGTTGTASLVPPQMLSYKSRGADSLPISDDFITRFADAYRLELGDWVNNALSGRAVGPSAWDGHVAGVVAAAGAQALRTGQRTPVVVGERPTLYGR